MLIAVGRSIATYYVNGARPIAELLTIAAVNGSGMYYVVDTTKRSDSGTNSVHAVVGCATRPGSENPQPLTDFMRLSLLCIWLCRVDDDGA